jgi:coproporphyrinogen III oxidase-like Fe-S oxidoreductase
MEKEVKTVKFLDRTFNANMKYMIDILDFIDKNNKCTTFQFEIVVEKFNQESINKVASLKSKFLRFEIGIQSTNEIVNESVCRKQNMELLEKNLKLLQETNKVDLHVDLIAGLPYETKDMFINSFNRVFSYKAKELQLGFLKFLRGTKMMDYINEHEYIYDKNPPYEIIKNKYMSVDDLNEIHMVEEMLETYYNSSKFKKTFNYLIDNKIVNNFYLFFKDLFVNFKKGQLFNLFIHIDDFFKDNFNDIYNTLHLLLIQDYLDIHKTKPKIWWNYEITKQDRKTLYEQIVSKTNINIEDLYRYSIVYKDLNLNKTYIAIYKNYKVKTTLL